MKSPCVLINLFNRMLSETDLLWGCWSLLGTGRTVLWGKIERTGKKYPPTITIPHYFQTICFLSNELYKRVFMEKETLSKLICFLIVYLQIRWMIYLGKSMIPLPLSMKLTIFFSSIFFLSISSLNIAKDSSSIFTFTGKHHTGSRILPLRTQRNVSEYRTKSWVCKSDLPLF